MELKILPMIHQGGHFGGFTESKFKKSGEWVFQQATCDQFLAIINHTFCVLNMFPIIMQDTCPRKPHHRLLSGVPRKLLFLLCWRGCFHSHSEDYYQHRKCIDSSSEQATLHGNVSVIDIGSWQHIFLTDYISQASQKDTLPRQEVNYQVPESRQ